VCLYKVLNIIFSFLLLLLIIIIIIIVFSFSFELLFVIFVCIIGSNCVTHLLYILCTVVYRFGLNCCFFSIIICSLLIKNIDLLLLLLLKTI